jgi:uncharacterized protein
VPALSELYPTAFVTGASSGLGRAFTEMLLAEGVRVWGTARDAARLGELAASRPNHFFPVALDLAQPAAAVSAFAEAAQRAGGAFDLVVNNAGYGVFGEFSTVPWEVWEAQIAVTLGGNVRLAHAAYRRMRERNRGCLVNVSSLAAEFPIPFMSCYNLAKAGLSACSESLVFESRGTNVRVIDFRPGDYRTAFNQAMQSIGETFAPAGTGVDPRLAPIWNRIEACLRAAPLPERAATDLRRALRRRRSGTVRSGSFFQARLAPLLARLVPAAWVRSATARYFSVR